MRYRNSLIYSVLFLCCIVASGKDKKKAVLPNAVLDAETVLVVIDPEAGVPIDAPNANQTARDDVEKALMNRGQLQAGDGSLDCRFGHFGSQGEWQDRPTDHRRCADQRSPRHLLTHRFRRPRWCKPRHSAANGRGHERSAISKSQPANRGWAIAGHVGGVSRQARQCHRLSRSLALRSERCTSVSGSSGGRRVQESDHRSGETARQPSVIRHTATARVASSSYRSTLPLLRLHSRINLPFAFGAGVGQRPGNSCVSRSFAQHIALNVIDCAHLRQRLAAR